MRRLGVLLGTAAAAVALLAGCGGGDPTTALSPEAQEAVDLVHEVISVRHRSIDAGRAARDCATRAHVVYSAGRREWLRAISEESHKITPGEHAAMRRLRSAVTCAQNKHHLAQATERELARLVDRLEAVPASVRQEVRRAVRAGK